MKLWTWILSALAATGSPAVAVSPAAAVDDPELQRLALCQESWMDWSKTDPARLARYRESLQRDFSPATNDPFVTPKTPKSIAGFPVVQLYPGSVGMGVGFSVLVDGSFDTVRQRIEKLLGKPLGKCETGEGMRTCALEVADQRTLTLMAEDSAKSATTLVGCYYFYEK